MKLNIRPKASTQSFALIVALLAVFVLTANAALLWYSMQVDIKLAVKSQRDPQLVWLGRSGMEEAKWFLATEAAVTMDPYDSLNELWAGGPGGPVETNSPLAGIDLNHIQIGDGWVSIKITDLESKVNVNTANPQLLNQVLTAMGMDANDMPVVSDSILDWVEPGNNPRLSGAKNEYYQSLNPPYFCKEAPMDDISELLLVKGVTWAIYTGEGEGTKTAAPKGFNASPFANNGYSFGLRDVMTTFSDGRININTADANVLQCIPGVDAAAADAIIKARAGPDGADGTADDTPFRSPGDIQRAGVGPEVVQGAGQYCDVRSRTFQVVVTAHYLTSVRQYLGIIWRNTPQDTRLVEFHAIADSPTAAPTPDAAGTVTAPLSGN